MIAAASCVAFTIAGCSSNTPAGNVTAPSPEKSSQSASSLPTDGAPNVNNPIVNTAGVETDPCSALTSAQIESFGGKVDRSRIDDLSLGKNCVWVYDNQYGSIGAGLVTGNKDGLSGIYYQNSHGGLTTFKPVPAIEGYPAVQYANGGELDGECTLAVGIRNDLVYTVIPRLDTGNPRRSEACDIATKVAQLAIKHLKET